MSNIDITKANLNRNVEDTSKNVNEEICTECGGRCCKQCGCFFSPYDFPEISFDFLQKEIEKGYISIARLDYDIIKQPDVYILRVRNQGKPIVDTGYNGRSQCILLTEKGCKLSYENRPKGGRFLIPSKEGCKSEYTLIDCANEWKEYQWIIFDLMWYFDKKEIQCSL